ncbi:MAG TPA: EAL domain-containing protein [Steroidobacteraceae bacterium]|jgi:diguanylate cyclase (GGDEF)-like protein/PAS domain S-box-containing protein|nr:EAL domain-containing protein [Steroidobacteraceae bacterium]
MTTAAWIPAALRRRSLWLAAGGSLLLVLVIVLASSQQDWRSRAANLERENTGLQLAQLAEELTAQSERLAEHARELAESDAAIRLVQETTDPSADRLELADMSRRSVNSLLVLTALRTVRFSVTIADGQLNEQPPDPALLQIVESMPAQADTGRASPVSTFKDDRWIAVRPIIGHSSPAVLGWLVASRSLTPALISKLALAVGGTLDLQPSTDFGLPRAKTADAAETADEFSVATRLSRLDSSGLVALRDAGGQVVRVLRLTHAQDAAAMSLAAADSGGGLKGYLLAALLALMAIVGGVALALRRYFRHQRSVDARYKALIDQANDGIVIVDAHTHQVLYTNPAFLSRLGYSNEEAQALALTDIFVDGNATPDSVLSRLIEADSQMPINLQQRCKNGSFFDTEVRCNALDVDGRDVLGYVTHDVSLRRKAEQQLIENQQRLDKMAHHDQLTGLPNRHYLTAFLPQAIDEAKAANTMLGVVFLDLDRFKHINDTRGHETGDKLLQEVAGRLRSCVRDSDVVIRMGGDEFVVVFRNVKNYDEVTLGAGRIIETLNRPIIIDRHPLQTTGSVGVSLYPRDGANMIELLKHSDTAMYQAKDRGRNNVQMFSHAMNRKLKHRVAVEASLREALRLKQLDVHYQPFVNLITRKIVGLEALMRWSHPVHGMIPADQFIPVAEETGLIVPMGNFVLHRTLQTMSAWRKAGIPLVPVSLNVAPAQLQRGELQSTISTLLKSHNLRPEILQLEMTERAVFDSHTPAGENRQDTMARLRDLGIKIAIDDFGTGYSSLSYLKNWRVDALKIDRSFVRDLVTDSSDLAIVSAIIAIARHLHIEVIAEGIEAYQQVEILRRLGCSIGQGFLFARPMPADDILKLLRSDAEPPKEEEEDMLAVFSAGRG